MMPARMGLYYFRARHKNGQLVEGSLTATSHVQGARELRQQGLYPIEIREMVPAASQSLLNFMPTKKMRNLAIFAQQTGAMLETGLPLLTCLELVKEQLTAEFRTAVTAVQQDLKEGCSLAAALNKHPQVFPPLMVSMVEAGELGGILVDVLHWMSELYEKEVHWVEKIKSALLYPSLVLILVFISLVFLFSVVIPNFAQMLDRLGAEIPLTTQVILSTGRGLVGRGIYTAVAGMLVVGLIYHLGRSPATTVWRDRLLLELPFVKDLTIKMLSARFCRILGALLKSGVPILQAVGVVKKTLGNQHAVARLSSIETDLQEGRGLGKSLAKIAIFPPQLVAVVVAGEESGQLPEFLFKLSGLYEAEWQRALERISILLEPALLLLLGGIVGFVVMALLLPLFILMGSL